MRTYVHSVLALVLLLTAPTTANAQLEQVAPEVIQHITAAASEAVKSGRLASKGVKPDPAWEKAFGYRIGAAAVIIVPDKALGAPAGDQNPMPLALVITRTFTVGDYHALIPPARVPTVSVPGGAQGLSVFFVAVRSADTGRTLVVYGSEAEPLATVPMRVVTQQANTPIALRVASDRFAELTFTLRDVLTASLRLAPPGGAPSPPAGGK
jgi:hypothetical protein